MRKKKIILQEEVTYKEFIEMTMLYDVCDWKRLAWGLYTLNENLLARVDKLEKTINVNINSKRLIEPKDLQLSIDKDISLLLPAHGTECKVIFKENLFENN